MGPLALKLELNLLAEAHGDLVAPSGLVLAHGQQKGQSFFYNCFGMKWFTNGNVKFHINSLSIQLAWSILIDFFQNKIIGDKSSDGA